MLITREILNYFTNLFYHIISLTDLRNVTRWFDNDQGICETPDCLRAATMLGENMDHGADPCQNFYTYACGNFAKHHPLGPYRKSISNFNIRKEEIFNKILEYFANNNLAAYSNLQKLREIYEQCVDEKPYGFEAVFEELEKTGLPKTPPFHENSIDVHNAIIILGKIHRYASFASFLFDTDATVDFRETKKNRLIITGTLSSSQAPILDNDTDIKLWASKEEIRVSLMKYIIKTVQCINEHLGIQLTPVQRKQIIKRAENVADFLLEIDKAIYIDNFKIENDSVYTDLAYFQKWTNKILQNGEFQIDWQSYFTALFDNISSMTEQVFKDAQREIRIPKIYNIENEEILIKNPAQLKYVLRVLQKTPIDVITSAMWFTVVHSVHNFAPPTMQELKNQYLAEVFKTEIEPRSIRNQKTCITIFTAHFPHFVGHILAKEKNSKKNRREVNLMLKNIRESWKKSIREITWLDENGKTKTIKKLNSITSSVSYVDQLVDLKIVNTIYAAIEKGPSFYKTISQMTEKSKKANLIQLVDRNNVKKKPPAIPVVLNAYYSPVYEHIAVPIGLLDFPFYNLGLDSLHYGTVGLQLAHELGHAFDLTGRDVLKNGDSDLWSEESIREYDTRTKCIEESYKKFHFRSIVKDVNGKATKTENIADSLGFAVALRALRKYGRKKKLKDFNLFSREQLFTLAFANMLCENYSLQSLHEKIMSHPYAPASARVNGVLRNSKEFSDIWNCAPDTPMNPTKKCEIFS